MKSFLHYVTLAVLLAGNSTVLANGLPRDSWATRWVAVQPPETFHKWLPSQDGVKRYMALPVHFEEMLEQCSGIRMVSRERTRPFFRTLNARIGNLPTEEPEEIESPDQPEDGTRLHPYPALIGADVDPDARGWFETAHEILPVDALILFPIRDGQVSVRILFPDRVLNLPSRGSSESLFDRIRRAADFIADTFSLPDHERRLLSTIDFPNEEAMAFYTIASRFSAAMPSNPGEKRLAYLRPMLAEHPRQPRLSEEVLRSLQAQLRANRTQDATPTIVKMAQLSLPYVLGTPAETIARDTVKLRPNDFASTLLDIVRYDADQTQLDNVLDGILTGVPTGADLVPGLNGARSAATDIDTSRLGWGERFACYMLGPLRPLTWNWEGITPEHRRGALRLLGHITTPEANLVLLEAAKDNDPLVRQAAATGLIYQDNNAARTALRSLSTDRHPETARAAMLGLWRNDSAPPGLMPSLRSAPDDFFRAHPPAIEAFAALAETPDGARLRKLEQLAEMPQRHQILQARFRLGDMDDASLAGLLLFEPPELTLATLRLMRDRPLADEIRAMVTTMAGDPDTAIAATAFNLITEGATTTDTAAGTGVMFSLNFGSPYHRISLLADIAAREDAIGEPELLEAATTNSLALIRFKALGLLARNAPEQLASRIPESLQDTSPWVRMQAASLATDHPRSEFAPRLRAALQQEQSESIRIAMEHALAKATGTQPPPPRPAAIPCDNEKARVWTGWPMPKASDYDYAPIEGFLTYRQGANPLTRQAGLPSYIRTLWGQLPCPESLWYDMQVFEELWEKFEGAYAGELLSMIEGFDLRILGAGHNWARGWRDFCRDAGIDPRRIDGEQDNLTIHERRAFNHWGRERWISGFNLMSDMIKLKNRFMRPDVRVITWMPGGIMDGNVAVDLKRWNNDLLFNIPGWASQGDASLRMALACRTIWPDRTFVYNAPSPGPPPDEWVYWNSPVPETFIFQSTNDVYAHTLICWLTGAHLKLGANWRFLDHLTVPEGLYTKSVNISLTSAGPDLTQIDNAIEHAFKDAPMRPPQQAATADALLRSGLAHDAGLDLSDFKIDEDEEDPKALAMKDRMRTGMRLIQKHMYDCARIFASLPRYSPRPDVLVIEPGIRAASAQPLDKIPANAARELVGEFDLLPGIDMVSGHDLSRYRMIVVHNATLLQDATIRKLTQWLKHTPGLLLIHQDLTSDPAAQASTVTSHDGILRESWPWKDDFTIPPAVTGITSQTTRFDLNLNGKTIPITADVNRRHAICHTPRARALAQVEAEAVLVQWRNPDYRGAVLFDGLRAPSRPYVEKLAQTIDGLAGEGIGRPVSGRPGAMDVRTESFHAVVNLGFADGYMPSRTLTGIDLISGIVDPVVGPGTPSALVPVAEYFNRYLACTPDLVALGEMEFTLAEPAVGGLRLQNAGLIQIAGRNPVRVTLASGRPLAEVPFDYNWVLNGGEDGVTTYRTAAGSLLTFVRCREAVLATSR